MNKLEKYLIKKLNPQSIEHSKISASVYYTLPGGRIIRISDHIGKSSDGIISIIYTTTPDIFIVHYHGNQTVSAMSYRQVKQLINTIQLLPSMMGVSNACLCTSTPKPKKVVNPPAAPVAPIINRSLVLGYPYTAFTPKQQQTIFNTAQKYLMYQFVAAQQFEGPFILGVDSSFFSPGELKMIQGFINTMANK